MGVSRQSVHAWLARYEDGGLNGLADRSHRPVGCPHQMGPEVQASVLEMRRVHRGWGPRRIVYELGRAGVAPVPSQSAVYRALRRSGLIEPGSRRRRKESWKRRERGRAMELWQLDVVAEAAERETGALTRAVARDLLEKSLTSTDAAEVLGLSRQRISQLTHR